MFYVYIHMSKPEYPILSVLFEENKCVGMDMSRVLNFKHIVFFKQEQRYYHILGPICMQPCTVEKNKSNLCNVVLNYLYTESLAFN